MGEPARGGEARRRSGVQWEPSSKAPASRWGLQPRPQGGQGSQALGPLMYPGGLLALFSHKVAEAHPRSGIAAPWSQSRGFPGSLASAVTVCVMGTTPGWPSPLSLCSSLITGHLQVFSDYC